ncbi:MAG TPA: PorP/SprF family type IX secretion system membrane protein [Bacteroidales bacterium]|nr:PorP/SprF family type IX secretion system membrane protein [Bacteroidales bacterium]HPS18062.1 PorP/SprF family type IX secretion system membrane protein [Bacteroidales bacterium]
MNKRLLNIIIYLFFVLFIQAQDIHLTQYYTSPLNLNPAVSGFFYGTQRFTMQNKSQWRSVTVPFKTFSASVDMPVIKRLLKQDMFGVGLVVNRDIAGDSKFSTTQVNLSFSYIKSISRINNQFVGAGIQLGAAQRSIDYSQLIFDSQFDGNAYNPALGNNEHFAKTNFLFYDISAGVFWNLLKHRKQGFDAGIAMYHINRPKQSLFYDNSIKLDRKIVIHAGSQFRAKKNIDIFPGILFMNQGKYREIDIGALAKIIKVPNEANYFALALGMYYRINDAFNFIAGIDYRDVSVGVSYDVNTSTLVPASNYMGGFEVSIIYIINKYKKTYVKKIPCPIF